MQKFIPVLCLQLAPCRLDLVLQERAVVEEAKGIVDYWSKRTIAGLLLMPPTRHCFIHLNEALKIKKKAMKLREVFATK
jgi:hypothetical protein